MGVNAGVGVATTGTPLETAITLRFADLQMLNSSKELGTTKTSA
jgi:hypothetical protein